MGTLQFDLWLYGNRYRLLDQFLGFLDRWPFLELICNFVLYFHMKCCSNSLAVIVSRSNLDALRNKIEEDLFNGLLTKHGSIFPGKIWTTIEGSEALVFFQESKKMLAQVPFLSFNSFLYFNCFKQSTNFFT